MEWYVRGFCSNHQKDIWHCWQILIEIIILVESWVSERTFYATKNHWTSALNFIPVAAARSSRGHEAPFWWSVLAAKHFCAKCISFMPVADTHFFCTCFRTNSPRTIDLNHIFWFVVIWTNVECNANTPKGPVSQLFSAWPRHAVQECATGGHPSLWPFHRFRGDWLNCAGSMACSSMCCLNFM